MYFLENELRCKNHCDELTCFRYVADRLWTSIYSNIFWYYKYFYSDRAFLYWRLDTRSNYLSKLESLHIT